jgi:hypothetical protein
MARPPRWTSHTRARLRLSRARRAYGRHRFTWLFASLLLTVGAGPTLVALDTRHNPLELLLALNLLAAIASVVRDRGMWLPLAIGAAFLVARTLRAIVGGPALFVLTESVWITAIVLAMIAAFRHAMRRGPVNVDRVIAALDAYLLAGLVFGVAYATIERLRPHSLASPSGAPLTLSDAIYFSFVTLATLGYGDVTPVSPAARGLAVLEGISGQLYLTVLVARLVSLYAQQRD